MNKDIKKLNLKCDTSDNASHLSKLFSLHKDIEIKAS